MLKLKNIFSILLVAILMLSTMSFSVGRHYCKGKIVKESLTSVSGCCEQVAGNDCFNDLEQLQDNCCETKQIVFNGIDVLPFTKSIFDFNLFYANALMGIPVHTTSYFDATKVAKANAPPLIRKGSALLLLFQRFLI